MNQLINILKKADIMDIDVENIRLSKDIQAVTIEFGQKYTIYIDLCAVHSVGEIKGVLMHELGHCVTGATHLVASKYDLIAKHEYKANRWAIEQFLPLEEIKRAARLGYTETWQLAEYFNISEQIIVKALQYYKDAKGLKF